MLAKSASGADRSGGARGLPGAVSLCLGVVCAIALGALGGGCNIVGAAFVAAHGPPKVPAAFELDPSRTHVVLIDDLSNRVPRRSLRDEMGEAVDAALLRKKVVKEGNLISSRSARRAAASDTAEDRMSAVDIGRKVGAEVIIYVTMTGWTLQQDPGFISPAASAQVRVLDVISNRRLWPPGERTHAFVSRMPRQQAETNLTLSQKSQYETLLARKFGEDLAKLFYTHERDRLSDKLPAS